MLQAFIITLREGVEAALIVGITLTYLTKIGRSELRRPIYAALGCAFLASLGVAYLLSRTNWNQDVFEGWIMLAAAFFVVTMIVFMMKTAKHLKGNIESKVGELAGKSSGLGLFVFVFLLILREGVETVLTLAGVNLNSSELMSFLGTLLGLGASVAFGVMFVKGSVRIDLRKFFKVTTVILWFVAAQLVVSGLHELSENGVLPSSKQEMALIGPIVRNDMFFFVTILALAALMILFEYRRRAPATIPVGNAERRKTEWMARRERLWMASVYITSFVFIFLVTAEFIYAKSTDRETSPAVTLTFAHGEARIPVAGVSDGDLHRFVAKEDGVDVRFWLLKKPDGNIAAVFDACSVCGAVGFKKDGRGFVCKNCSAPINPQSVGTEGGCNPIPLKTSVADGSVVIPEAELLAHAGIFKN
jgi:FTR1 family protein